MEKIKVTSGITGDSLDGTLVLPENIEPNGKAILFLHGWRSSEEGYISRARALAELGYTCLAFSLRGHGKSDGDIHKLTRQDFLNDAIAAYDFLKNYHGVAENQIGVVGASFGGYLATLLTKKRPVRWLVLRAPANYPDRGFEDIPQTAYPREDASTFEWRERQLDLNGTVALRAIHQYPHEILMIESGNDVVIPHQTVQNFVDAVSDSAKLTHIVMKDADHAIREEKYRQEFIRILVDWFRAK